MKLKMSCVKCVKSGLNPTEVISVTVYLDNKEEPTPSHRTYCRTCMNEIDWEKISKY